jgi:pimeloyl-ACP methyl ester carboxylesterase
MLMTAAGMVRRDFAWDGGALSGLYRTGPGPILFLHGLSGGAVHFDAAFETDALAGRGLLALDLPGFGESFAARRVDVAAQVDACREALRQAGFARPWVVAHSMAASAAARLAAECAGAILLEGNLLPRDLSFSDRILSVAEADFPAEYRKIQKGAEVVLKIQTRIESRDARARYASTWRQCSPATVRQVAAEVNADTRAAEPLRLFRASGRPVTAYFGDSVAGLSDAAAALGLRTRTIPRAGHFLMLDNPAATYAAIGEDAIPC